MALCISDVESDSEDRFTKIFRIVRLPFISILFVAWLMFLFFFPNTNFTLKTSCHYCLLHFRFICDKFYWAMFDAVTSNFDAMYHFFLEVLHDGMNLADKK